MNKRGRQVLITNEGELTNIKFYNNGTLLYDMSTVRLQPNETKLYANERNKLKDTITMFDSKGRINPLAAGVKIYIAADEKEIVTVTEPCEDGMDITNSFICERLAELAGDHATFDEYLNSYTTDFKVDEDNITYAAIKTSTIEDYLKVAKTFGGRIVYLGPVETFTEEELENN